MISANLLMHMYIYISKFNNMACLMSNHMYKQKTSHQPSHLYLLQAIESKFLLEMSLIQLHSALPPQGLNIVVAYMITSKQERHSTSTATRHLWEDTLLYRWMLLSLNLQSVSWRSTRSKVGLWCSLVPFRGMKSDWQEPD